MSFFTEPLTYDFMLRALLAGVLCATACSLISVWITKIGWSLIGDAISHAVLPGVVLAFVLGIPFIIGALFAGGVSAALIRGIQRSSKVKPDTAIGVAFTTLFSLGLVLVSLRPSSVHLTHILFGSLVGIRAIDLLVTAVLSVIAIVLAIVFRRPLTLFSFDRDHLFAMGKRPAYIGTLLLALLTVSCVVTLQTVGVILVVAMLIIPGASAALVSDRINHQLIIAPVLSIIAVIIGLYASYWLDVASGGTIVLILGLMFGAAALLARVSDWRQSPKRRARAAARQSQATGDTQIDAQAPLGSFTSAPSRATLE